MLTLRGCSWNVQHMSSQSFVVLLKPPVPLPLCYNGPSEYVSTTAQGPLLLSHFAVCMRYMYSSKNSLYVDISELTCKVSSFWLQLYVDISELICKVSSFWFQWLIRVFQSNFKTSIASFCVNSVPRWLEDARQGATPGQCALQPLKERSKADASVAQAGSFCGVLLVSGICFFPHPLNVTRLKSFIAQLQPIADSRVCFCYLDGLAYIERTV